MGKARANFDTVFTARRLVAAGCARTEIAYKLGVSERTVYRYMSGKNVQTREHLNALRDLYEDWFSEQPPPWSHGWSIADDGTLRRDFAE